MLIDDLESFYDKLLEASEESEIENLGELFEPDFIGDSKKVSWTFEKAIKNKNVKIIESLLSLGCKIDVLNGARQTALHLAVYYDFYEIIDTLFSHCLCNVNYADSNGLSHFHVACISGNAEIARQFINDKVDVNLRYCCAGKPDDWHFFTALHFAVEFEKVEVVELLLKSGADPNALDCTSTPPLHLLCRNVSRNKRPFQRTNLPLNRNFERFVGQWKQLEILELLTKYGADVNFRDLLGHTPMTSLFQDDYLEVMCCKFYLCAWDGESRRESALECAKRKIKMLECLLRKNANPNLCDEDRETILHFAVRDVKSLRKPRITPETHFTDSLNAELIRLLLEHGAKVDAIDRKGKSPLQIAISLLNYEAVEVLLNYDADVSWIKLDCEDDDEDNCFYYYKDNVPSLEVTENLIKIVDSLASRGLRLSRKDNLAILRFFVCNNANCRYGDPNDVHVLRKLNNLLELGTDANIRNALNTSPDDVCDTFFGAQVMRKRAIRQIYKHLTILEIGSLHLSEEVRDCLKSKLSRLEKYLLRFLDFEDKFVQIDVVLGEEVQRTKTKLLNRHTSLHELLAMSPRSSYPVIKNSDYAAVLYDKDFWKDFPNSGGIIRGHFAKSLVRRYVEKSSSDYLRLLTSISLPDLCCDKIIGYLSNECLFNLCLAASHT